MGYPVDSPWVQQAIERGLIPADALAVRPGSATIEASDRTRGKRKAKPALVDPLFVQPGTWLIPCEVPSLANDREWQTRSRVAQAHRRAVSRAMGRTLPYLAPFAERYHSGGALVVKLTRLGGKALDRTANLPASLKYIEDAIALMVGADDGAVNWLCECDQQAGGACGVRVELVMRDDGGDGLTVGADGKRGTL